MERLWIYFKKWIIIAAIMSVFVLFFKFRSPSQLSMSISHKYTNHHNKTEHRNRPNNLEWTPYMDFVEESILMRDEPLNDIKQAIDPDLTRVSMISNSSHFSVGEEIRIGLTLSDGYGHLRKKGGDQLRVRIFEEKLGAYASGYVVDHYNGSYTAVVRALWKGKPKVEITIGCPRDIARAWYNTVIKTPGTRVYLARYRQAVNKPRLSKQEWLCHPFLHQITNVSKYFCDRTMENDGMSLYCARPAPVSCQDFDGYEVKWVDISNTFTNTEYILSKRKKDVLKLIEIKVDGPIPVYRPDHTQPRCSDVNSKTLWLAPSPVGFFFKKYWRPIHCQTLSPPSLNKCLNDKHFVLLGDSTVRQWFEYLQKMYSCKLKKNTRSYKQCYSDNYNFSVDFSFHAIPGHYMVEETTIHSIASMITKFAKQTKSVILFHQQTHLSANHPGVFRDRMIGIRKSIQMVLKTNKDTRFYFKGPHTFRDRPQIGDYFGFVYRTIALEVFDGLLDHIVYLDSKDMTIATKQTNFQPDSVVVKAMVEQFLAYVC